MFGRRASTSAIHAWGSISFIFAVTIRVYIKAALSPPRSELAKSHDLRPRVNSSEGAFGGVIGPADAPVVEERCEGRPPTMFRGGEVVDGFGDAVVFRQLAALCDQPATQTFDQWA